MPFNPDKFLQETTPTGAFDPDKFLTETAPVPTTPPVESALAGAAEGASLGFADELVGAGKAAYKTAFGDKTLSQLPETYRTERDQARGYLEKAQKDNPKSYLAGQIGGGVASSAALPGIGAARGIGGALGLGAAYGLGESNADLTKGEVGQAAKDAATGAAIGGVTHGAVSAVGAGLRQLTPENAAKKVANVVLNTPEEITDLYIKNPQGVREAPKRFELAQKYADVLDNLKNQVMGGSEESRAILSNEGKEIQKSQIAGIAKKIGDDLEAKMGGIQDDPEKLAALKYVRNFQNSWEGEGSVGANRVKDTVQTLQRPQNYDIGAGQFTPVDQRIQKNLASDVNNYLKGQSPAYTEQMTKVAADSDLLSRASDVGKNPKAMTNVLRRVVTDEYGAGQIPAQTIGELDKRMGTNILEQAKLSNAREAFDKSITNGSRNVNMFSNALDKIPYVGKAAGALVGGAVDKYGRPMAMGLVDKASDFNQYLENSPELKAQLLRSGKSIGEGLTDLLARRDPEAIAAFQFIKKSHPEYIQGYEDQQRVKNKFKSEESP